MRQSHLLLGDSSGQNDTRARKMDDKMKRGTSLSQINDDAMEDIFSRLSAKEISISKCVCTKWNGIMSHNSFIHRYCQRSLVAINKLDRPGGAEQGSIQDGWYIPKIYVCNPISKEFIYSFTVFSSKTSSWRILDAVFNWDSPIHRNKNVFVNGIFHWLATNHRVITFDLEKEAVGVVNLPGPIMEGKGYHGVCIGSSGERLAYIVVHPLEIRVWILKDHGKSEWFLENQLSLDQFYEENKSLLHRQLFLLLTKDTINPETKTNGSVNPLAFGDDVLYMVMNRFMYSYEFKTRHLKKLFLMDGTKCDMSLSPTAVPYAANLIAMDFLKAKPRTGNNGADS
ncbi:uncharacterized protein LOC124917566 isoform X4 [Impatiens glandulifera]|uniref:uncharacterized protein LOC124917566 isoform X4 n=1 Tax=Impatiens glandulifera TaxID=253017 RepID=UPI001FB0FBC0|nr:uncharacterized protein LOC124917566 isoform X4 [Impatiens glandulifera]